MTRPDSAALRARMMTLHPAEMDLSLDRVHRLLATLGNPERKLPPVVHIAGTNGKGSTLAMLRAGLEAAGQQVHAYTSPNLVRFNERIRLAGTEIDEPTLVDVLSDTLDANGAGEITYFEATTIAAFLAFSRVPADTLLLEVGLGGRLDVTNVIDAPRLTVITSVSYDHQDFLGDTLAQIAAEKAGILKRGVPCVLGPQEEEALEVIEHHAARLGVPLLAHGQHWHVWEERGRLVFQDETGLLDLPMPVLRGPHQIMNAGIALAALRHLGHDEAACTAAITRAEWHARMQRLRTGPLTEAAPGVELWLDGGHNIAAGAAVAETLGAMPTRPTHLICGMLDNKDCTGFLAALAPLVTGMQAVSIPDTAHAARPEDIVRAAQASDIPAEIAPSVTDALARITAAQPDARVLICGSLYLAGHVLAENG
ncbi:MAG: folylpolyglutamate synthase/dihydrofolate synthase family protein [Celeribacter sp.]|jgi:dihydrofolate synthase/folylpolyglutamate synthase